MFERKETGRIEAFSDGVFAIAITLLVLTIKVPRAADLGAAAHAFKNINNGGRYMRDELVPYYRYRQMIGYRDYRLVINEKITAQGLSKFIIDIIKGDDKVGEHETDNQGEAVHKIKLSIDLAEKTGGPLNLNFS